MERTRCVCWAVRKEQSNLSCRISTMSGRRSWSREGVRIVRVSGSGGWWMSSGAFLLAGQFGGEKGLRVRGEGSEALLCSAGSGVRQSSRSRLLGRLSSV
jgi:hypothetical protein